MGKSRENRLCRSHPKRNRFLFFDVARSQITLRCPIDLLRDLCTIIGLQIWCRTNVSVWNLSHKKTWSQMAVPRDICHRKYVLKLDLKHETYVC